MASNHPFVRALYESKLDFESCVTRMLSFSERLRKLIGMSPAELRAANSAGLKFEAGDYLIQPRHGTFANAGWHTFLMVTPKVVGDNVGWRNIPHEPFPDNWFYFPKGTGTVVCTTPEIEEDILRCVHALYDSKESQNS